MPGATSAVALLGPAPTFAATGGFGLVPGAAALVGPAPTFAATGDLGLMPAAALATPRRAKFKPLTVLLLLLIHRFCVSELVRGVATDASRCC